MQVDSLKKGKRKGKGKNQHKRGNRTTSTTNTISTDINTCKNCGEPGRWAKYCWNFRGGAYDNSTCRNTGKGKSKNIGKGKGKHVDVVETEQPQPLENSRAFQAWTRGSCEYLLLDSGAQLHACPIPYPGQKIPLLDPGIHTASGARLQHDGGRLVTYKLPEGRTIRVLFHACAVQFFFCLGRLAQQGYWSDLRADTGTLFCPDNTQTKRSHTQLHKEEFVLCQRDDGCALDDSWSE